VPLEYKLPLERWNTHNTCLGKGSLKCLSLASVHCAVVLAFEGLVVSTKTTTALRKGQQLHRRSTACTVARVYRERTRYTLHLGL